MYVYVYFRKYFSPTEIFASRELLKWYERDFLSISHTKRTTPLPTTNVLLLLPILSKLIGISTATEIIPVDMREKNVMDAGGDSTKGERLLTDLTTLFIGQMPYDTKVEHIVPWLKTILKREGCAGDVHAVRLAGGGTSNRKFRGFAFVDFKSRKAAKKCRKFHNTLFRGRKVSIEPCSRKNYSYPKSTKGEDDVEGDVKRQLKRLVDSDSVDAMVKEACFASEGTLREHDLDEKLRSFLSLLPRKVGVAALKAIQKQTSKAPRTSRARYFMGIVKKVSKQHWDKSEAKRKRVTPREQP